MIREKFSCLRIKKQSSLTATSSLGNTCVTQSLTPEIQDLLSRSAEGEQSEKIEKPSRGFSSERKWTIPLHDDS